jgi:hypothetical protein
VREAQRPENDGLEHDGSNDTFEQTSVFIMDRLHQAVAPGARSKFTLARQINTCRRTTTCSPCTSRPGLGFFWRQISGAPTDLRNAGALGLTTFTGDRGVMSLTHDRLAEAAGIARALAARLHRQAIPKDPRDGKHCSDRVPGALARARAGPRRRPPPAAAPGVSRRSPRRSGDHRRSVLSLRHS